MKEYAKTKERERATALGVCVIFASVWTLLSVDPLCLSQSGDPALEEEAKLRNRVTKGAWAIAKDKAIIHMSMEKVCFRLRLLQARCRCSHTRTTGQVAAYQQAFDKIRQSTNIGEIDDLVQVCVCVCVRVCVVSASQSEPTSSIHSGIHRRRGPKLFAV